MKKGQIQMLETFAVLVIFFILIVIGIVFYAGVARTNIAVEQDENIQLNSIKIAQAASFLPELQCSEDNIVKDNCIDLLKLEIAAEVMNDHPLSYFDKFAFSRITVQEVYPESAVHTLYDRSLTDFQNKIVTNIPVSLLDPVADKHAFGIITVEFFVQ